MMPENPLADYDRNDAEECNACMYLEDLCPYHMGFLDGVRFIGLKIHNLVENDL